MDEQKPLQDRDPGPQSGIAPTPPAGPVPGRRRLLTGGLSATGVVLTLASRPVLGWQCKTPSAQGSMTHASHHPDPGGSAPKSKSAWEAVEKTSWPTNSNKVFNSVFTTSTETHRMYKVLHESSSVDDRLFVVAYLNIFVGDFTCLAQDRLLSLRVLASMYAGTYRGPGGTLWTRADVMKYLSESGLAA